MKYLIILLLFSIGCIAPNKDLFTKKDETSNNLLNASNIDYTSLNMDSLVLDSLSKKRYATLSLNLPYGNDILKLSLKIMDVYADGFVSNTDKGEVSFEKGLFYYGVVEGIDSSTVSLSITNKEVNGIISSPSIGDIVIGKVPSSRTDYLIYDPSQFELPSFECSVSDTVLKEIKKNITKQVKELVINPDVAQLVNGVVTIDFELSYEAYVKYGSVAGVNNFITSLFAPVKVLFQNDGINVAMQSIYVWTTDDGYNDNAATALVELAGRRKNDSNFKGNLIQLVRPKSGGALSGIAYVGGLCTDYRFSYSEPMFTYAAYPAYSWSANVIVHELGHNLGSPHTHSCSWPGGPIDNCMTQEGSCNPGPRPAYGGGTIMSYCHLLSSVGINFSNGFGPLPSALIRQSILNAQCVKAIQPPVQPPVDPPTPVGENIALNKPSKQSSDYSVQYYPASKANDGRQGGANFSHTLGENYPYWQVDLGAVYDVSSVEVVNRYDCCGARLKNYKIFITPIEAKSYSDASAYTNTTAMTNASVQTIPVKATGRYVRIWCDNSQETEKYLNISEVKVLGVPSTNPPVCKDTIYKVTYYVPMVKDSIVKICK